MSALYGAAALAAGKTVFDYNRENFQEDREMRMKMEFAQRKFRVAQAKLWREDVRDFISLTERKMSIYLLVNVLMLGFNLNLWCEGRLPEGTPEWLILGNQLAIGGSFTFLLLTVWLAMHAAVAAQSYQTRILTQLVRLPVPTWAELEACRTAGSDFERVEPRQMFRVPFLMGWQENVSRHAAASASATTTSPAAAAVLDRNVSDGSAPSSAGEPGAPAQPASDPWGLERSADDSLELGTYYGEDLAKMRHIKLVRQAAVYWQTYDAFARVSMTVGVNQLMLAISYYILGYAMTQVTDPMSAITGVAILIGCAEMIAQLDLTLPLRQRLLIQVLLIFGPFMAILSSYHFMRNVDEATRLAECLAPVAFISHGLVVALLTLVLRVREQENGAMLPMAFQGVLYLDVFGWVAHKKAQTPEDAEVQAVPLEPSFSSPPLPPPESSSPAPRRKEPEEIAYYAMDYFHKGGEDASEAVQDGIGDDDDEDEASEEGSDGDQEGATVRHARHRATRPTLAAVRYDRESGWQPQPTRPVDAKPPGAPDDMRHVPDAPRMHDTVNAVEPPGKAFWDPVTFMPSDVRSRDKMDALISDVGRPDFDRSTSKLTWGLAGVSLDADRKGKTSEDWPIQTGHDNEAPGHLPYKVFKMASVVTTLVWFLAAFYYILDVAYVWTLRVPFSWEHHSHNQTTTHAALSRSPEVMSGEVVPPPSILQMWAEGFSGRVSGDAERIEAVWPYGSIVPRGISCDASGSHFVVTDGLSAYAAELQDAGAADTRAGRSSTAKLRQSLHAAPSPAFQANFRQVSGCSAVLGKAVQDAAMTCAAGHSTDCEVLLLHHGGSRIAACPLAGSKKQAAGSVSGVSSAWLRPSATDRQASGLGAERASWLLLDPSCGMDAASALREGCASVRTTHGRLAMLKEGSSGKELVPEDIVEEIAPVGKEKAERGKLQVEAEASRAITSRYIGVLQEKRGSIRLVDTTNDGSRAGSVILPSSLGPVKGFCVGGEHIYLLERGHSPGIWRIPLPAGLRSNASMSS